MLASLMLEETPSSSILHPIIYKLLQARGIEVEGIADFFDTSLRTLPDLSQLHDLKKAARRIVCALEQKENISVYGDYDVDGTTSCALLYHFFKSIGKEIKLIQPSRFVEGYGIHPEAIAKAAKEGVNVLITVDCGITNCEAASHAQELGVDLIITDHHTDGADDMPRAFAVINPNRRDEDKNSPLRHLAGVGVAFCLALQIKMQLESKGEKVPSLYPLLQFFALGTICDMVPLTPLNLKLCRHGLKQMPQSTYPGIKVFLTVEERMRTTTSSEKISFEIGPMINSKGRMDHPRRALELLISDDPDLAYQNYSHLKICNNERKQVQAEVFADAKEQVIKEISKGEHSEHLISLAYGRDWHEGVIGIVASRLVETFKVPAIVFAGSKEEGVIKASARSAGTLSIFDLLSKYKDLFYKFGGHKAAAGFSMAEENLSLLKENLNSTLENILAEERTMPEHFDLEIAPADITPKLMRNLEMLEPFGMGNKMPLFKMSNVTLTSYQILKDAHVRWEIENPGSPPLRGISFNYIGKWGVLTPQEIHNAKSLTTYFNLGINRFRGNEYIQLRVEKFLPRLS